MKKIGTKVVSIALALCTLGSVCGCGETGEEQKSSQQAGNDTQVVEEKNDVVESQYPEYLNLDGYKPIVKEDEKVTLKIAVKRRPSQQTMAEDRWFTAFIEERLNIDLEIIEIEMDALSERLNLMFGSGDLPDILWDVDVSNDQISKYGVSGEMFLPISDYMDETLTPNLLAVLEEYSYGKELSTLYDGKIYAMPHVVDNGIDNELGDIRFYVNTKYMDAAGITELPGTLDEFVEMLRAFKALDPAEMGVDEIWPVLTPDRGYFENYIAQAFGWMSNSFTSYTWDFETGEIVVPCLQDKYKEYVKLLNTMYTEGLIHEDYFTMDRQTGRALAEEGKGGTLANSAPYTAVSTTWADYVCAKPLTSEWNSEAFSVVSKGEMRGDIFISADTEYPEVCMRLLDYLYSPEGAAIIYGAPEGSEDNLGMIGGLRGKDTDTLENAAAFADLEDGKFDDLYTYQINELWFAEMDNYTAAQGKARKELWGFNYSPLTMENFAALAEVDPDMNYRYIVRLATQDYFVDPLPLVYMSEEDAVRYTDLFTVIENYVAQEVAKFVVGQRPLEELDAFMEEVYALNGEEYLELCQSFFAAYER